MNKPPIYYLSDAELDAAVAVLVSSYPDPISAADTRTILSDCITSLGGLFARPTTTTSVRHQHFFRARNATTFASEDETKFVSQYGYLPNSLCTSMGRCHGPGHSVFYGSNNLETAVKEIRPEIGDLVAIALWVLPPTSTSFLEFVCPSNAKGFMAEKRDEVFESISKRYPNHSSLSHARIRAHCAAWSDLFLANGKHSLSSSIAHQNLNGEFGQGSVDGIVYGSTVDPRFVNFALNMQSLNA